MNRSISVSFTNMGSKAPMAFSIFPRAIVFSATKRDADALAVELTQKGHRAAALHGDMPQGAGLSSSAALENAAGLALAALDVYQQRAAEILVGRRARDAPS